MLFHTLNHHSRIKCSEAMNQAAKEVLIIYEEDAKQWATYLQSVVSGPLPAEAICLYDIGTVSSRRDDFLHWVQYTCKLLILSKGMLEGLCQIKRFFLARVLSPASQVVVLLCGVDRLEPFLKLVPLDGDQCVQISSEQEANEYVTAVMDTVKKGLPSPTSNVLTRKPSRENKTQPTSSHCVESTVVMVPSRVPCGGSVDVFLLLKNESAATVTEVHFSKDSQIFKLKPTQWSDSVLCLTAPDFPAGIVKVTVLSNGVALNKTVILYYSDMEEINCLLTKVADPVSFMCQALQVSSVEKLDQKLTSMMLKGMPSEGFEQLQWRGTPEKDSHGSELPTMLHFAAQYGLKSLSSVLLQCPGAERAVLTANHRGHTPIDIARNNGYTELHVLLKEALKIFSPGEDNSVYEMMCAGGSTTTANSQKEQQDEDEEDEEDPYNALGDIYDCIEAPTQAVIIANRPPAPTPRPETTTTGVEDRIPYITKVLQKLKKPGNTDMHFDRTKQAQGQEDSTSSTYDTFVSKSPPSVGLQQLTPLPQRVRAGSLPPESALDDRQRVQKGVGSNQQENQPRRSSLNTKVDDSVYDKINIIHHTACDLANESRRNSQPERAEFYSKPLKGHHTNFFWKADKR